MKLTQFWQQLMLRLALIGAVLAVCVMWGGLVAPVSAESTASVPVVSLSPRSLNFGNQQVNTTSAVQTVTLTNTSNANLTIHSIGLSGTNSGDFHQSNTCPSSSSTLAAGDHCFIDVTFKPTAEGSRSASLTITGNASNSPQSVALSGTGVVGMPPTGSDPYAQPPADNSQQVLLGWFTLIVVVVAAALISGSLRRSRPR